MKVAIKNNILVAWLEWHLFEAPRDILKAFKNFLLFYATYFSIPLLLKTLFSHWHKYKWEYPRGFFPAKYAEILLSNLISRTIGALMRIVLIFIGVIVEICVLFAGLAVLILWLLLPIILIVGFVFGIVIIF